MQKTLKPEPKIMRTVIQTFIATVAFLCFATLEQHAYAVTPPPDGGYPHGNTAEGQHALLSLTTGSYNTGVGFLSLGSNSTNSFNTAIGAGALLANTEDENTATGAGALLTNSIGAFNTANGAFALARNTIGSINTATGDKALVANTTGIANTATGASALVSNDTGSFNTAQGTGTLAFNTGGGENTAIGEGALAVNAIGNNNTAIGASALYNTTGNNNVALGFHAGYSLTTGDDNINIGNPGVPGDANTIRIGDSAHQSTTVIAGIYGVSVSGLTVAIDSSNHLGTVGSSRRLKENIKPMDKASEAILALKPVTFHYKNEIDPAGKPQFGLVAEDVEKVSADLIVRDKEGKPYTVRYDAVNVMLLNEFLKARRQIDAQQKQIDTLTAALQKVSEQVATASPSLVELREAKLQGKRSE